MARAEYKKANPFRVMRFEPEFKAKTIARFPTKEQADAGLIEWKSIIPEWSHELRVA